VPDDTEESSMVRPPRRPREIAQLLRRRARSAPREVEEYLDTHTEEWSAIVEADPHDAADILEELGEDAATDLLTDLSPDDAADVLEEMQDDLAADILEELDPAVAAGLLEGMPADEAADVIGALEPEAQESILPMMEDAAEADVRKLLAYPPDSAGGLMTTQVAKLPVGMTTGEAIERIRQMNEELEDLSYVYIVDDDERLVGVLSFRDLVFKRPGVGLDEAMVHNPVAVGPYADREEAAELTNRYHLFSIPVVDANHHLLGMVTNEEVIEAIQLEATEDFAVAAGAGAEETVFTSVTSSVRMRIPWLSLNLVMALLVAFVIEKQTGVISREPVLAALMPVIALLGGNGGFQSLAVVIRSLATDDVPRSQVIGVLGRQFSVGVLNGLILGVLSAALTMALLATGVFSSQGTPPAIAGVVGLAAFGNVAVAGLAGASIPLLLRKLGADPAQASSIFLTLVTDLVGFGGFLLVAAVLL
jgi:magnesium transporter